ncbi:MAG: trehalose-phosphatase [Alphaproteobacteria bacterium]|nr:trehalose-phosphatase [Alphaproteobacteria bacterium]
MPALPLLNCNTALFLDVDGTLIEIAPRPEAVRVPSGLGALLARLTRHCNGALAVVSGRPLTQIDRLLTPWAGAAAGLHGQERRRADGVRPTDVTAADRAAAQLLTELRPTLEAIARALPGVWIEDKGGTLALHCRAVPEKADELAARLQPLLADQQVLRLIAGKMVYELQPRHHGKGAAIAAFLSESPFCGRTPVFVGDDTTDEDGFVEVNRRAGTSVRVGAADASTAAAFTLPSVDAVLQWLQRSAA